jgi:hypothetical protein
MAAGTLYTYPNNFRAFKILIAARYSNEQIRVVSEPPEFVLGETNKTGSFLEKFPFGKVRDKQAALVLLTVLAEQQQSIAFKNIDFLCN